jgi:hypothetical protein
MRIDYGNPDPERGIFGCAYSSNKYAEAKIALPKVDTAISALSQSVDNLLAEASSTYYTSRYGPSGPFRSSARISIEKLEKTSQRISKFVTDMRANFLRETEAATNPVSFFLSYSHKDWEFADRFVKGLREQGHTVWRDDDNIMIGESVRRSIESGMASSRFTIVLVSRSSVQSEWCQKELDMALADETSSNVRVLPIVIDDCEVPGILRGKRYLVFKDYERDFQKFLTLLPCKLSNRSSGKRRGTRK